MTLGLAGGRARLWKTPMSSKVQSRTDIPSRRRRRLLQGVSTLACATALGAGVSWAGQISALRNAAHVSVNPTGAPSIAAPVVPGLSTDGSSASGAMARSLRNATAAQQTANLAQQAQTAAQQAAAALPSSVPNGLAPGGLVPVLNAVLAANDPTGLNTWQGANAPTQSTDANGRILVDVQQTAQRAVLDWQTFNVGSNTTLNFDQSQNGAAQPDWVVLNRVVGQLDPTTGLRNPNLAPAPSQILGQIKAPGTVLVINQNGILFGAGAQVNTNALIASSLEIGAQLISATTFNGVTVTAPAGVAANLAQRDNLFLTGGILSGGTYALSSQATTTVLPTIQGGGHTVLNTADTALEGAVTVAAGAQITSGDGGYIILAAPNVSNAGALTSNQGQVSLVSGRAVQLLPSTGSSTDGSNPNIRGLAIVSTDAFASSLAPGVTGTVQDSVVNASTGVIQAPEGYVSLITTPTGQATNAGVLEATTSVARNGFIQIGSSNVTLAPSSVISITPDDSTTIPQDPNSLADFKPSLVEIGATSISDGSLISGGSIDISANSLIYAPSANIYIGSPPALSGATVATANTHVFIDSGAVIDASGLKGVQVSGAVHQVTISPVTANDTADTPSQRTLLDHATVTVDPRLSGVRADGVAWVGSPLIPAEDYAQQIGVSASQLMTKGGNVLIGALNPAAAATTQAPDVIIKPGAVIDISGGWTTYEAGWVRTTQLVSASGQVVNIGDASPDDTYVGVYSGYVWTQPRYGISQAFANPLLTGGHYESAYSEGADAGSLTILSSQPSLQGTIYAGAYTGPLQAQKAAVGTATSSVFGDQRHLQAVGSQLPMGGFLSILELTNTTTLAGGDVEIVNGPTPTTTANLSFGQSVPVAARGALILSAQDLNAAGLGQLSIFTSGAFKVDAGADLALAPGGAFTAVTGRAITVDGSITVPSGAIALQTVTSSTGSIFNPAPAVFGDYDVSINGRLSAAGLWTNDFRANGSPPKGDAYIDGGSVAIQVAARVDSLGNGDVVKTSDTTAGTASKTAVDISGSILVDGPNSLIDVSAGGYVKPNGDLELTAKGGDVSLIDDAFYFPFALEVASGGGNFLLQSAAISGFRVNGLHGGTDPTNKLAVNPSAINARVAIGDGAVRGYGFAGGGTFSLDTPSIAFADGVANSGTNLPLDFFSKAGFGTYDITSYGTALLPNAFVDGAGHSLGGYNAVLKTQVLTVNSGQTLDLTQTGYTQHLSASQTAGLLGLASNGQISSVLAPTIDTDAFDQRPINLNFGGLVEFEVAPGGAVVGAAGAGLTAGQINNQGTIQLPGGTLGQSMVLPGGYAGRDSVANIITTVVNGASLADIFSIDAGGNIEEGATSKIDPTKTNAQVAAADFVYLTGDLPANVGIQLAPGSVTDLSGAAQVNPFAVGTTPDGHAIMTGRVVGGGVLQTAAANVNPSTSKLFTVSPFEASTAFSTSNPSSLTPGLTLNAAPGSTVDLAGASATFDQLNSANRFTPAAQWSDAGSLIMGSGGTLTGASIDAHGGASEAAGGVLTTRNLILTQTDPAAPTANTLSAAQIEGAGFGSLTVQGDLATSGGPVDLTLGQGFYLTGAPTSTVFQPFAGASGAQVLDQSLYPTVSVAGSLQINAPYIALAGAFQQTNGPTFAADHASAATGVVSFNAQQLDVTGAVLFDQAVAKVQLNATGDLRLIGVAPHAVSSQVVAPSLMGQLAVNGDLTLSAAQVYATTGSSFDVSSAAAQGTVTIAASGGAPPPAPYSAGSNLLIQAANIVQDGVLRAPVGALTLGSNTALTLNGATYAPATQSVTLGAGSITSVSANGLSIPYGTTTDQKEYYFNPINPNPLTAPPTGVLTISGRSVTTQQGATVDLSGGGDVFAYEFVPGTGGSRDVLSQFNADAFTSNGGYQFPDRRQVYAIVPGLSDAPVAAYDPIYSSNYSGLYGQAGAGQRVYLNGGPGLAAGWYTLLPAQYAVLPGGMEVVQDTSAVTVRPGVSSVKSDGTLVTTGQFGGLAGTAQSTPLVFDVKSRAVIDSYSNIVLTSADTNFAALAAANGGIVPRLPVDAGRLVLNPSANLSLSGQFQTAPGQGGRGAEVDITGSSIAVVSDVGPPVTGVLQIAAGQLSSLNADSLLIGGVRTDNVDGSTSLSISAHQVSLSNDAAHPLSAPEVLLATDGAGGGLILADGATITATGAETSGQSGDYVITGVAGGQTGRGAVVRVSSGAPRLVTRTPLTGAAASGGLTVGAVSLTGASVLLDSSDAFTLSPSARLTTQNLALSATNIAFAPTVAGGVGLVITPGVEASLGSTALTLRSQNVIGFTSADYGFGDLTIDAPGLAVSGGTGAVSIEAGAVTLRNSSTIADAGACNGSGLLACGAGTLALNGQSLDFQNGTVRVFGAGHGVTLSAPGGVTFDGQATFDVAAAPLSIATPFLGDGSASGPPGLTISTTGALTLSNPSGAAAPAVSGTPGASLTLAGGSVSVTGVDVRATAGTLNVTSATGITVGSGATIETPGYSRTFGDAVDPYVVSAPGGLLTLTAQNGDIVLQSGSTLSVGGGTGNAGSLTLTAGQGQVSFGGTLDGAAPGGGASFNLSEAGAFDLNAFAAGAGRVFNGDITAETGMGDLVLAQGNTLKAANVGLTADGGRVDIAGTIDVSGVNGGQIGLFGAAGVTLESAAVIAARASGYPDNDTRQASGGLVELGTAGLGAISVASGAVIDVSAARTNDRIVEGEQNGLTTYNYVAADQGGQVVLRAPAQGADGHESVNVSFAGTIAGADSVVVEGYRAYDLAHIGAQFVGVDTTTTPGTAILSTTATASGKLNLLADEGAGTIPTFIQQFNISSSYGALGGLASQANFHAQPGVELDYSGNITLASNWNFGAGVVNVAGATAAGLMTTSPATGLPSVVAGDEGAILANFTHMTYRVGGTAFGEPGRLSIRATGNVAIGQAQTNHTASITDGFFAFGDQTDPTYLSLATGGALYNATFTPTCQPNCGTVAAFAGTTPTTNRMILTFATAAATAASGANLIPYDAAANTPGALGSGAGGAGDPLGSAELFPLIQGANGLQPVQSWSYQVTAGSKSGSANPAQVRAGATGALTVQGTSSYTYGGTASGFSTNLDLNVNSAPFTASGWLAAEMAAFPNLNANSAVIISFANPSSVSAQIKAVGARFFSAANGLSASQYVLTGSPPTQVATSLGLAAQFVQYLGNSAEWQTIKGAFTAPGGSGGSPTTVTTQTLIRTGTGSIGLSAAGNIDLRNCSTTPSCPVTLTAGFQRGGVPVYTAGAPVRPGPVTAIDDVTGAVVTLDPTAFETLTQNIGTLKYGYGLGSGTGVVKGVTGLLIANPVYADDGGDISLAAGGDVLGRRDAYDEQRLTTVNAIGANFIGYGDQPWRMGTVGAANAQSSTNILVNPQLFFEGLGAIGGGDVTVRAGGKVSDLTIASDTSITTGTATGGVVAGQTSQGLITFGGGNVTVAAGGDLLGSRIDVASGAGDISAGGSILSAGSVSTGVVTNGTPVLGPIDNTLRLRLADATVDLSARGNITIEGVRALGVQNAPGNTSTKVSNGYAANFYSPTAGVSATADGSVTFQQGGDALPDGQSGADSGALAILPGSLSATALTGDLALNPPTALNLSGRAIAILLEPSPRGSLLLAAGGDIEAVTLAQLDNQPNGTDAFPAVLPSTTLAQLQALHDPLLPRQGDPVPNRVYAGQDIDNLVLTTAKQTRVGAGRDIVNMAFFGQNVDPGDITRIQAGRDIIATTVQQTVSVGGVATQEPVTQGNTFVLGGPGELMIEAGRNLGPFLTSATVTNASKGTQSYAGGVTTVGNAWNPYLPQEGASVEAAFGVGKGEDFAALSNYYLDLANTTNLPDYLFDGSVNGNNVFVPDKTKPIYAPQLIAYMQQNEASALTAAYGTTAVTYQQAYGAFTALPALAQRPFLLKVYFNELAQTSVPGPTLDQYQRGYLAANLLFPASLGYTQNALTGGTNGANALVQTGDLDLRLATIETQYGGDIDILGPGGRVLGGSTVATAQQAARRFSNAEWVYAGEPPVAPHSVVILGGGPASGDATPMSIDSIPAGYEGVLTLRGGGVSTYTDGDFLLNQSRLFTEQGGDVIMWSSNGDLNAGQGPKTSSNFPPVKVRIDADALSQVDQASGVSGAGIAALQPAPGIAAPNVYLIAPRGTVDAGAAGIRVAGNVFVAALHVANADNFQVAGTAIGLPPVSTTVQVGAQTAAASASAVQAAQTAVANAGANVQQRSVISVDILGFGDEGL